METHGLSYKRIMGYTAVVLATLALLVVLYRLGQVVLLFVLSVIVAAALRKGVLALESRRIPRGLAILLWYILIIGLLGLGIYFLGAPLGAEFQMIGEEAPQRYDALINRYQQSGVAWQNAIAQRLPDTDAVIQSLGEGGAAEVGFQVAGLTSGLVNVIISLVAILTLTFYWLVDQDRFERLWLTLLPVQQRAVARNTWRGVENQVGAYVRSEAFQFVGTITLLWIIFQLLGVPFPTLWAIYAGVVQLIPWIGLPLTLLPLVILVFFAPLPIVVAVAAAIIGVGLLMDRIVEPRLSGDTPVHPITIVVALMILGEASGVLGMLIALPLAATIQILLREMVRAGTAPKTVLASAETSQIQELQARIDRLRQTMPVDVEQRREAEGMLSRLQELLDRTTEVVRDRTSPASRVRTTTAGRRIPAIFQRTKTS